MNTLQDEAPLILDVFELLWRAHALVRIPDSVVYRFGRVESWYFSAARGVRSHRAPAIMRKRKFQLRQAGLRERIEEAMGAAQAQEDDVLAVWMTAAPGECSHVRHLTKAALHDFLRSGPDKGHGVLQRFVRPIGGHNSAVRTVRTPHYFNLECRTNWYAVTDARVPLAERLATFEGAVRHVKTSSLRRNLHLEVEACAAAAVEAIDRLFSENKLKVWVAALSFKFDSEATLFLCGCSQLTLAEFDEAGYYVGVRSDQTIDAQMGLTRPSAVGVRKDSTSTPRLSRAASPIPSVASPIPSVASPNRSVASPIPSVASPIPSVASPIPVLPSAIPAVASPTASLAPPAAASPTSLHAASPSPPAAASPCPPPAASPSPPAAAPPAPPAAASPAPPAAASRPPPASSAAAAACSSPAAEERQPAHQNDAASCSSPRQIAADARRDVSPRPRPWLDGTIFHMPSIGMKTYHTPSWWTTSLPDITGVLPPLRPVDSTPSLPPVWDPNSIRKAVFPPTPPPQRRGAPPPPHRRPLTQPADGKADEAAVVGLAILVLDDHRGGAVAITPTTRSAGRTKPRVGKRSRARTPPAASLPVLRQSPRQATPRTRGPHTLQSNASHDEEETVQVPRSLVRAARTYREGQSLSCYHSPGVWAGDCGTREGALTDRPRSKASPNRSAVRPALTPREVREEARRTLATLRGSLQPSKCSSGRTGERNEVRT
ncbi:hypothetical protein AB1Y20_011144 [Prymnesium parvum]|uniref:Uncharacterized protein n=1 Tax=Prymnesium parvum TaxID=97485 RepID=A0AB34INQ2_PRYPA